MPKEKTWINTKDKLPNFNEDVLIVISDYFCTDRYVSIGRLVNDYVSLSDKKYDKLWIEQRGALFLIPCEYVTHWMSLPELPKKPKED